MKECFHILVLYIVYLPDELNLRSLKISIREPSKFLTVTLIYFRNNCKNIVMIMVNTKENWRNVTVEMVVMKPLFIEENHYYDRFRKLQWNERGCLKQYFIDA
jgi:hypothetical protein